MPLHVGKSLEKADWLAMERLLIWIITTRTMIIDIVIPIHIPNITDSVWVRFLLGLLLLGAKMSFPVIYSFFSLWKVSIYLVSILLNLSIR